MATQTDKSVGRPILELEKKGGRGRLNFRPQLPLYARGLMRI